MSFAELAEEAEEHLGQGKEVIVEVELLQVGLVHMKAEVVVFAAEFECLVVQQLRLMVQVPWKKIAVALLAGVEPQLSHVCHGELERLYEPAQFSISLISERTKK